MISYPSKSSFSRLNDDKDPENLLQKPTNPKNIGFCKLILILLLQALSNYGGYLFSKLAISHSPALSSLDLNLFRSISFIAVPLLLSVKLHVNVVRVPLKLLPALLSRGVLTVAAFFLYSAALQSIALN